MVRQYMWSGVLGVLLGLVLPKGQATAQTLEESFYLDFGPDDQVNGNATLSPDFNGRHWNNLTVPSDTVNRVPLLNAEGNATGVGVTLFGRLQQNGLQHGGLVDPDVGRLADLGVVTATQDFFLTTSEGGLVLHGLNPDLAYSFELLASRDNVQRRVTEYDITGANSTSGQLASSGRDLSGPGLNANRGITLTTDPTFPTADGTLRLSFRRAEGNFAYLNALRLDVFSGVSYVNVASISIDATAVNINGATAQLRAKVLPEDAVIQTVSWRVDDVAVATISPRGQLVPRKNGAVTAFAKTEEPGSSVEGSGTIVISNQDIETYFFDFGPDNGTDGNATAGTDANGNQWTNLNPTSGSPQPLISSSGTTSTATVAATGLRTNGLRHGGLTTPTRMLLGELGVGTATQDYAFVGAGETGQLTFSGLDPAHGYRFFAFASRDNAQLRTTRYTINGRAVTSGALQSSGANAGSAAGSANDNAVYTSQLVRPTSAGTITLDIAVEAGSFAYLNALQLVEHRAVVECPDRDAGKLIFMGSSVARGQGAPNDQGYAYQYSQLLEARADGGVGIPFMYANVSIGGNRTTDVLNRYNRDLIPECGSYVAFGLSLANEGIRNGGQATYDQFRTNLLALAERAKADGLTPIIVSNYARGDYDAGDYEFIKAINQEIAQWPYPSVNVLGALDDGTGRWPAGYAADNGHPNLAGHTEFYSAWVPSLLDALAAGKPAPVRQASSGIVLDGDYDGSYLSINPSDLDETPHSFTSAFELRADRPDVIAYLWHDNQNAGGRLNTKLLVTEDGRLKYEHNSGDTLASTQSIFGQGFVDVALTYYQASKRIQLYLNGELVGTLNAEYANGINGPEFLFSLESQHEASIRQWHYYRSGMNADEIQLVAQDSMLKSSLAVYAPLDASSATPFANLAQSTDSLEAVFLILDTKEKLSPKQGFRLFPNPAAETVTVVVDASAQFTSLALYDLVGRKVLNQPFFSTSPQTVALDTLVPGKYIVALTSSEGAIARQLLVVD